MLISKVLVYAMMKNPIDCLRFMGYGQNAHKDPFPRVGQVYLSVDTYQIWYCEVDGIWIEYPPSDSGGVMIPISTIEESSNVSTVAADAQTTIVTYTNNTGGTIRITGCIATGQVDAEYVLMVNGSVKGTVRSSESDRTAKIVLPKGIMTSNGDIVTVKVTHWENTTSNFSATIYGHKFEGD